MEATYTRIELAIEQLDVALELFLSKRSYVSALTLAGAAEEIFGSALKARRLVTTLESEYNTIQPVQELLHRKEYHWKDYITEKNKARNAAKHMDWGKDAALHADLEDEALWMIVRAEDNCRRLGRNQIPRMQEFSNWFYENVVGI